MEREVGMLRRILILVIVSLSVSASFGAEAERRMDERAARPGEWGFRPAQSETIAVTPPGFVWRPQKTAVTYELQCARDAHFTTIVYQAKDILFQTHCPPRVFEAGQWFRPLWPAGTPYRCNELEGVKKANRLFRLT